ncbi:MAG: MSHA biogenesis protein MshE [Phenylobacterium sp.]|jgi:MSHA biogenesis protein MshE
MARPRLKMRLGDLLVQEGILIESQLMEALKEQKSSGRKLGAALIDLGHITEEELLRFLAQQLDVPFVDITEKVIEPAVAQLLPEVHARRHRALVIDDYGDSVVLGMSDPADLSSLDQLAPMLAPKEIQIAVVKEEQILEAFDRLYRRTKDIESFAQQLQEEYEETSDMDFASLSSDTEGDATVVQLLRTIFEEAVVSGASDIHIEPDEGLIRIRQRIDGVLQEDTLKEANIASALVLRLKLMGNLDISEKRLPQDGRFNIKTKGHSVDIRMSTMPTQYGESVVMRLLDQTGGLRRLDETGMPKHLLDRVRGLIRRPHGMILVTGPTGSGKTTTLYGALAELNEPGKKIITVEDPVEYRLPRVNQVQINTKIGLDFSSVLRTTLRQDPDILMVGEMRDQETVQIGLRGALTGHLVLSTLHTNDAITSALRLIDMGAQPYLVASSLRGIIAQRLVRKICENCREEATPDAQELMWLQQLANRDISQLKFFKGRGCQTCNHTGYKGRLGVFELLEMNVDMMDALRRDDTEGFGKCARENETFVPFGVMAFDYALDGVTSIEEVLRVAEQITEGQF